MAKFLVKVPAEVTASATIYCGVHEGDDHPASEYRWSPYVRCDGRTFDLHDKPRTHATEAKAIAAGKRELMRRLREWNKKEGLA